MTGPKPYIPPSPDAATDPESYRNNLLGSDSQPEGEGAPGADGARAPIDALGEIELDDTPESAAAVSATGGDDDGSKDATAAERTKNVDEPSEPLPLARELREADPEPDDDNLVNFDPDARRRVRSLEILDPLRWHDQPVPERRWLVKGLIPRRVVTLLAGDGGLGKSLLVQQLLTACATGKDWLDRATMNCRVLGVFCEDDADELHRRQDNINQRYGLEFADLGDMNLSSRVGDDSVLLEWERPWFTGRETPIYDQILNFCRDNGIQCLVLDSLHDVFAGDENKRPHARQFINALRDIAIACDAAVIVTAHPSLSGRASGTGEAGSTAWNNAVRSRLYLKTPPDEDDEDLRILATMKSNYGRRGKEIRLRWTDGVFINQDPPISGTVAGIAKNNCDGVFLTLLDAFDAEGRTVSEKLRASNYAPRAFAMRPDRRGHSKKEFQFAMERLFAGGKIRVEGYSNKGRPAERIVKI